MRIHVNEVDRAGGARLYEAIAELLRKRGLAGVTITQCILGFGATRRVHSDMSEVAALDLPVVIECVDDEESIMGVLPALDELIGGGLITLERADVITYRGVAH